MIPPQTPCPNCFFSLLPPCCPSAHSSTRLLEPAVWFQPEPMARWKFLICYASATCTEISKASPSLLSSAGEGLGYWLCHPTSSPIIAWWLEVLSRCFGKSHLGLWDNLCATSLSCHAGVMQVHPDHTPEALSFCCQPLASCRLCRHQGTKASVRFREYTWDSFFPLWSSTFPREVLFTPESPSI